MPSVGCKILLWSFAMIWTFSYHAAESAMRKTCGRNSVYMHHRFRIVSGRISERGMWPWQIGIYYINYKGDSKFICGGALVSRLWILTAAHCFYDKRGNFHGNGRMYLIKAGDHSLSISETSQQEIAPEKIFVHHEFKYSSFVDGDIALIKLSRKVTLNMFVKTVCLPEEGEGDLAKPHSNGIVAGWGITQRLTYKELQSASNHKISKVLRHVDIKIQSDHLCLNKAGLTYNSTMTFCAGDGKGGSDACKGDSGGAFVRHIRTGRVLKQWVAIGIVSWGYGCAQKDQYGYYTRVYPFIGWIKKTINDTCTKGRQINYADLQCVDIDECRQRDKGGCSHGCVNTLGSYLCTCPNGFKLNNGRTCQDIDECRQRDKGGCRKGCLNTLGSYRCECQDTSHYRQQQLISDKMIIKEFKSCLGSNKEDMFKYVKERGCFVVDDSWDIRCRMINMLSQCFVIYYKTYISVPSRYFWTSTTVHRLGDTPLCCDPICPK